MKSADQMSRIRVLIVDDNLITRRGLRGFLEDMGDTMVVVGETSNGSEAIEWVEHRSVDVILMNICGLGSEEIAAVAGIVRTRPEAKVLVLTPINDPRTLARAIRAGVGGVLVYDGLTPKRLVQAIRSLVSNEVIIVPPSVMLTMPPAETGQDMNALLSPREKQILDLMAAGKRNVEIARSLGLKEKTVKNHLRNIYSNLKVRGRFDAMQFKWRAAP